MRTRLILYGATALSVSVAAVAVASAPPAPPKGNFGGGAIAGPSRDLFGPGSAVVALRALAERKLEIEATVRGKCAGGDIAVDTKLAADGSFSAKGSATQEPNPGLRVRTSYELTGTFRSATEASGTLSATLRASGDGATKSCKSGTVTFGLRRPIADIGTPGAVPGATYYGTTAQRSTGPRRPIVLRVSEDGAVLERGLFGEAVRCSDDTRAIGVEAPRTNLPIDGAGRVTDHERSEEKNGTQVIKIDDRFTGQFGSEGARGTFSLSDRTVDKETGYAIRSCKSGTIKWTAAR